MKSVFLTLLALTSVALAAPHRGGESSSATCAAPSTVTVTATAAATSVASGSNNVGSGGSKDVTTSAAATSTAPAKNNNSGSNNNNNNGGSSNSGLSFGSCSTPEIKFAAGLDGRKETAFAPVDTNSFPHGSADNIDVITSFICGQLQSKCKANQAAISTCKTATSAADAATKGTGAQADAFNAAFGKTTSFAAVQEIDNTGKPVGGSSSGGKNNNSGGSKGTGSTTTTSSSSSSTSGAQQNNNSGGSNNNNGGNNNNNGGNNNSTGGNNNDDPQSSLTLDPRVIATGFEEDGQQVPTAGQIPSLTSSNNFINFCLTVPDKPITNGQQIKGGSCNPAPMGVIASTNNMPSSKFVFPANGGTVQANQPFTIKMAINHLETGNFVNANSNYYSAPQQVNGAGDIIGHTHVVIEQLESLGQTTPTDPSKFAFFKGVNTAAVNGVVTADVTDGLPKGVYRLASINAAANHQPVLVAVAQHGSLDDMVYFTVN